MYNVIISSLFEKDLDNITDYLYSYDIRKYKLNEVLLSLLNDNKGLKYNYSLFIYFLHFLKKKFFIFYF